MQEIADWLDKLGMSQYAQRFAENDIDVRALRYLTDQDLKDIGVSLGHRRRTCGGSLPLITIAAQNSSSPMVVSSQNIWVTAFSPISATPKRMNMMPSARFAPASVLSRLSQSSALLPARLCTCGSGSRPASLWSAT